MLHILDQLLHLQKDRNNRSSFLLHVLYVDQSAAVEQTDHYQKFELLKQRFPSHSYSVTKLEDIFYLDTSFLHEVPQSRSPLVVYPDVHNQRRLEDLLAALPSATAKADFISTMRFKLIVAAAKAYSCEGIIFGDSTTRLAERTLSETAKGRGGALPWLIGDGPSPHGVRITYLMRDLLKKEISAFVAITSPPLAPLIVDSNTRNQVSTSSRRTTIEDLMGEYFESVEQNFPNIVANVVRTSSRLAPPLLSEKAWPCKICGLPVTKGDEDLRWSGEQETSDGHKALASSEDEENLCYGCARSILQP